MNDHSLRINPSLLELGIMARRLKLRQLKADVDNVAREYLADRAARRRR